MRAVVAARPGGPDVLTVVTRPRPAPGAGEILIKVEAAGVNRPDVMQRQGGYKPPPGASDIPGLEVAGRVAALGEGVSNWRVGDPVTIRMLSGGVHLKGRITGVARGITDRDNPTGRDLLADVNPTFNWVRLAQRVPVRIHIDEQPKGQLLVAGTTCTVVITPHSAPAPKPAAPHPA